MVKSGTKELRIEAILLSICVCAKAKRNTGIKLPINPEIITHFHSFLPMLRKVFPPIIKNNAELIKIRIAPNWKGVKPLSPFFISM